MGFDLALDSIIDLLCLAVAIPVFIGCSLRREHLMLSLTRQHGAREAPKAVNGRQYGCGPPHRSCSQDRFYLKIKSSRGAIDRHVGRIAIASFIEHTLSMTKLTLVKHTRAKCSGTCSAATFSCRIQAPSFVRLEPDAAGAAAPRSAQCELANPCC